MTHFKWYLDPLLPSKKMLSKLDPIWQNFLDPLIQNMVLQNMVQILKKLCGQCDCICVVLHIGLLVLKEGPFTQLTFKNFKRTFQLLPTPHSQQLSDSVL